MEPYREKLIQHQEKIDKRKARTYSTLALLVLLLGLWLPLIAGTLIEPEEVNRAVLIQFEEKVFERAKEEAKAAAKSSTKKSEAKPADKPIETPTVEAPAPEPVPETAKPTEVKPEPRKTVTPITTEAPKRPKVLSAPSTERTFTPMVTQVAEKSKSAEAFEEAAKVAENAAAEELTEMADFFPTKKPAGGTGGGSGDQNTQSDGGEADFGTADSGNSNLNGNGDSGFAEFEGDGLFTRGVVTKPDITAVIKQSGKISFNLCVNNDGKVVYVKVDPKRSTIKDPALLKIAESKMVQYRFEEDHTVSNRQCTPYTIVLKDIEE